MKSKATRVLLGSLSFPIITLAQTPASNLNVNPNIPDVAGLFVEVLTEMHEPTPQEAIGAPGNLTEPNVSSVLPMPNITSQPVSQMSSNNLQQLAVSTTTPASPSNPSSDPPAQTAVSSQTTASSSNEQFTTLEDAEKAVVALKRENAQLQQRLNNLNKQLLLLRQSFQQANSALLQRINGLQPGQGKQLDTGDLQDQASAMMNNADQAVTAQILSQMPPMENEVPLSRENSAQIVPMPSSKQSMLAGTDIAQNATESMAPLSSTSAPEAQPNTDLSSASTVVPNSTASTTVQTLQASTNTDNAVASVPSAAVENPQTEISPMPALAPVPAQTQVNIPNTEPTTPPAANQPQTPEGQTPQEGVRSQGSPAWQAAMAQQRAEEQQRQEELRQQQLQAAPASEEMPSIAPPVQSTEATAQSQQTSKSASRLETLTKNTGLEGTAGGIKQKLLDLLNDTGFVLKLGIGLAVLGVLWLLLAMLPKKSKKEEYDEDLFDNYESEHEEEIQPSEAESEDWTTENLESDQTESYLSSETTEADLHGDEQFDANQASAYAEPEYQGLETEEGESEYKYEGAHEDELEEEDEDKDEYAYHHEALKEELSEDVEEAESGTKGEIEDRNDESFFIADEELDREDMLGEEPHVVEASSHDYDFSEHVEDSDNVAIKLDLARAYLEMRDFGTAEEVLNTIMHQGTPAQQQDAQNLMDELKIAQSE